MTTTVDFIKAIFAHTENPTYVCSFTNERGAGPERHIIGRDPPSIIRFREKWDIAGRGMFFCVSTIDKDAQRRAKDTVSEIILLFVDIDLKDVDGLPADKQEAVKEVLRQLARLKCQPSITVASGNGVHAYWLLKEAVSAGGEIERIEAALRQLADIVAGDLNVCEVARVMRLPGTHNTKNGDAIPVEVIGFNPERRYELDDLEAWFAEQSPVMLRKERERGKPVGEMTEFDFFAEYAKQHGIKPPIDVEARLKAMMYMGGGESSIHQTQLECTASMLSGGMDKDEVVRIVLDHTKVAAGNYGGRWNWRREERSLYNMCDTWLKKHPQEERTKREPKLIVQQETPPMQQSDKPKPELKIMDGGRTNAAPKPEPQKPVIIKREELHIQIGRAVLEKMEADGERMINTKDGCWFYSAGVWELRTEARWMNVRIESACEGLGFKSTTKVTNESRNWIERRPSLWREGEIPWDRHGKIPTKSGLIDPVTWELEPAKPEHFATWRIDVAYDPAATCPWWEVMINDMFGDHDQKEQEGFVQLVQELFGCALIDRKPRALSKGVVFWGIQSLGKSGPLDVISGLFGGNPIASTISSVETTHGMMPFARRAPWVLHEAFNGQWNFSNTVKSIITQEPVQINVKNGPMLMQVIRAPIFWATNFQPQFKEATRAIVNRLVVIEVSREFDDKSPIGAAREAIRRGFAKPGELIVATELQGVLNWAMLGLRRALERGFIEEPASVRETADMIHRDSNLVAGFLDECIEFNPKARLRVVDFCLAHSAWWMELKGEDRRLPTNEAIGKALKAIGDGRVGTDAKEMRDSTSRYYCGIALNKRGLEYYLSAYQSNLFEGKVATASDPAGEVNSLIPASWDGKPSVRRMQMRHKNRDSE